MLQISIDRKIFDILEELKVDGGPFCSADEFQEYLEREDLSDKNKKKRMRFARESSNTLLSTDLLFKIYLSLPNRRRRDKNTKEFGDSLMSLLGKKSDLSTSKD